MPNLFPALCKVLKSPFVLLRYKLVQVAYCSIYGVGGCGAFFTVKIMNAPLIITVLMNSSRLHFIAVIHRMGGGGGVVLELSHF